MEEATDALEKNKERAEELQAGLMKPGQDLGTLAYFQKQLADTRAEEPLLKAAEDEAKRTFEDLQVAERLLEDSEKALKRDELEFANSEKRLVSMKMKLQDAKAKTEDLRVAENSTSDAYAKARGSVDTAEETVTNHTAAVEATASALTTAEREVKSARATLAASESALSDAKRDEASTFERLGQTKQEVAELEASLKTLVEEEADAHKAAALAVQQMRDEEEGIESLRANLTKAREAIEERRKELGPPPGSKANQSTSVGAF
jgi:chromosome segregation ATPase